MCYFLINILKITVSARRSIIPAFVIFVLKFHFITQQFLLVGVQDLS